MLHDVDIIIAVMLTCGIAVKIINKQTLIQAYLIIANTVFSWYFWTQDMKATAALFIVAVATAIYYLIYEINETTNHRT